MTLEGRVWSHEFTTLVVGVEGQETTSWNTRQSTWNTHERCMAGVHWSNWIQLANICMASPVQSVQRGPRKGLICCEKHFRHTCRNGNFKLARMTHKSFHVLLLRQRVKTINKYYTLKTVAPDPSKTNTLNMETVGPSETLVPFYTRLHGAQYSSHALLRTQFGSATEQSIEDNIRTWEEVTVGWRRIHNQKLHTLY